MALAPVPDAALPLCRHRGIRRASLVRPDGVPGFWPMRDTTYYGVIAVFGLLSIAAQIGIVVLRATYGRRIRLERLIVSRVAELYWKRTLYMAACADLVSSLGLIAFLMRANWHALVAFCIWSYLLYAQVYPRGRFMDET